MSQEDANQPPRQDASQPGTGPAETPKKKRGFWGWLTGRSEEASPAESPDAAAPAPAANDGAPEHGTAASAEAVDTPAVSTSVEATPASAGIPPVAEVPASEEAGEPVAAALPPSTVVKAMPAAQDVGSEGAASGQIAAVQAPLPVEAPSAEGPLASAETSEPAAAALLPSTVAEAMPAAQDVGSEGAASGQIAAVQAPLPVEAPSAEGPLASEQVDKPVAAALPPSTVAGVIPAAQTTGVEQAASEPSAAARHPSPIPPTPIETAEPSATDSPALEIAAISVPAAPIAAADQAPAPAEGPPDAGTEPEPTADAVASGAPVKKGFWARLASGLARTASSLGHGITDIVSKRKLDAETLEELEDILIRADLGVETAMRIVEAVGKGRHNKMISPDEVKSLIAAEVERILEPVAKPLVVDPLQRPFVVLMVGVNGSGKTTTIGKLAAHWRQEGKKVTLAAGDTFRAAAIDQLKVWGQRTGTRVIARAPGADAAGVAHDALTEARAEGADILMIDTAGRLQNRTELMAELEKIVRVIKKLEPAAPHAVLLVLDATVGQNALSQVEAFTRIAGVTGLVMTKLDGTARGGILVAIAAKHRLPVHLIGVGEGADDLQPFTARDFARAIAGLH